MHAEKLKELGDKLKERRLEKGLEREAVAVKIKVSAKNLYALEEALTDSLPQPIFAKGFARSYAQALGMNMEEMAPLINEAFPSDIIDNINPELSASAREQSITINQTSNTKVMAIVVPLLLVLLCGAGFGLYKFWGEDIKDAVLSPAVTSQNGSTATGNTNNRTPATTQTAPVTPPADITEQTELPAGTVEPPQANSGNTQQEQPPVSATETTPPVPVANSIELPPTLAGGSNTLPGSPIPAGTHRVVLFARYESWIGAEFDEIGRRSFTLEAGQTFALDFKSRLRLTIGNAGGIDMSYDGQPYALEGRFREAKVLNFP